jgi:hypothetical protein
MNMGNATYQSGAADQEAESARAALMSRPSFAFDADQRHGSSLAIRPPDVQQDLDGAPYRHSYGNITMANSVDRPRQADRKFRTATTSAGRAHQGKSISPLTADAMVHPHPGKQKRYTQSGEARGTCTSVERIQNQVDVIDLTNDQSD